MDAQVAFLHDSTDTCSSVSYRKTTAGPRGRDDRPPCRYGESRRIVRCPWPLRHDIARHLSRTTESAGFRRFIYFIFTLYRYCFSTVRRRKCCKDIRFEFANVPARPEFKSVPVRLKNSKTRTSKSRLRI